MMQLSLINWHDASLEGQQSSNRRPQRPTAPSSVLPCAPSGGVQGLEVGTARPAVDFNPS